jgi:hypothetical protein
MVNVIRAYTAAYSDPIKIRAGDRLLLFDRESEWPGWVWCRATDGKEGWVPAGFIYINDGKHLAAYDYDAKELSVCEGEAVEMLREESGWGWCRDSDGNEGWLPLNYLDLSDRP